MFELKIPTNAEPGQDMSYRGQSGPKLLLSSDWVLFERVPCPRVRWGRFHDWDAIYHDIPI